MPAAQISSGNEWEGLNMYGRICPLCGANLDPGEKCDCQEKEETASGGNDTESGKQNKPDAILASNGGKINDQYED